MKLGKKLIASVLAFVMFFSTLQFSTFNVQAEELYKEIEDGSLAIEEEDTESEQETEFNAEDGESEVLEEETNLEDDYEDFQDEESDIEGDDLEKNESDMGESEMESDTEETKAESEETDPEETESEIEDSDIQELEEVVEEVDFEEEISMAGSDEVIEVFEIEGAYQFGNAPSDNDNISITGFSLDLEKKDMPEVEDYLYRQMKARNTKIVLENYNNDFTISHLISAILNEHPELYFVRKSYSTRVSLIDHTLTLRLTYDNTLDDNAFQRATAQALATVKVGMSDLEKAIVLHDYLAVNCEYDYENYLAAQAGTGSIPSISHSAYGALVNRTAVCEGYALAYKYLLNQVGIECYMVTSFFMSHAWNLVELDGEYYHADVTWADPVWDLTGRVQHKYMFRSDSAYTFPSNADTRAHIIWDVTKGNDVVNYKAMDTRYDNAFWTNCESPLVIDGEDCYYVSSSRMIKKAALKDATAAGTDICSVGTWNYTGAYSGLFLFNGRLYYNTRDSICSIGLDGNDERIEFTANITEGYIYGSAFCQGKILYSQHWSPNLNGKETVLIADIEDITSLIPVENIVFNQDKLVLAVNETAMLQVTVVPDNAYDSAVTWLSSNDSVATVKNGEVTAVSIGICTITAIAGSKEATCNVTVTADGSNDKIAGGNYKNITWNIDANGKLTVEGTGEFSESTEIDRAPWSDYRRSIRTAEIKVTGMKNASYMFYDCSDLTSLDLSDFDTVNVTDMSYLFQNCSSLVSLDLSNFNTGNVTNMSYMFYLCTNLTSLNLSSFDSGKVTDMRYMFAYCSNLISLDLGSFDTGNVKYMRDMFYDCNKLISLDLSNFNTGQVIYMDSMFYNCNRLASLNLSGFDTHNVGSMRFMFYECNSLINLDLSSFDTSNVINMEYMFFNCYSLTNLDLSSFSTGNVTDMDCMFSKCRNLIKLDLHGFYTSKVKDTDMAKMFYGCSSLTSLDLSSFDTSNITYMGYMFYGCSSLTSLDLSSFDTSNVTYMGYMFYDCNSLTNLDLSNFDTGNVTRGINHIFDNCSKLNTIYTPYHLKENVELPAEPGDAWYQPDGTMTTVLPKDLDYSIILKKNQIPNIDEDYIIASKQKTVYELGDILNTDDLTVKYCSSGIIKKITDYRTNVAEIDMSTLGTKTLIITYNGLTATVEVTVIERTDMEEVGGATDNSDGLKVSLKNEEDKVKIYTGKAFTPKILVTYEGKELKEGIDYTVKYSNNIKVGTAKITVTGKGNFSASKTENFKIVQADINKVILGGLDKDGKLIVANGSKLAPVLYYNSEKLSTKDYIVGGEISTSQKLLDSDNGKTAIIKGKGNFAGKREIKLKVMNKSSLIKFTVSLDKNKTTLNYDGKEHYIHEVEGAITVIGKDGNMKMKRGKDYTIVYPEDVTNAGTKKFTVVGMGFYTGTVNKTYTIKSAVNAGGEIKVKYDKGNIDNIKLPFISTGVTFNDKLMVTYRKGGNILTLEEGIDYKVTYKNNKKTGDKAKFTVSFLGNFKGNAKQTRTFTIEKGNLEDATVIIADIAYKRAPGIYKSVPYVIETETNTLVKPSNYTVTYYTDETMNTQMKGKNKVMVDDTVYVKIEAKAKGNYKSDNPIIKTYHILQETDLSKMKVIFRDAVTNSTTKKVEYTGNQITAKEVKVLVNGLSAEDNEDIVVTYVNNINKGKATVILTGTGKAGCSYAGCKTATFSIVAHVLKN